MTSGMEIIVTADVDKVTIEPEITERNYPGLRKNNTSVIIRVVPHEKEYVEALHQPLPPAEEIKFNLLQLQELLFKNQEYVDSIQTKDVLEKLAKGFAAYTYWKSIKI